MSHSCIHIDGALLAADFYLHALEYEAASSCLKLPIVKRVQNSCEIPDTISSDINTEIYRIQLWLITIDPKNNHSFCSSWLELKDKICIEKSLDVIMSQVKYVLVKKITRF